MLGYECDDLRLAAAAKTAIEMSSIGLFLGLTDADLVELIEFLLIKLIGLLLRQKLRVLQLLHLEIRLTFLSGFARF